MSNPLFDGLRRQTIFTTIALMVLCFLLSVQPAKSQEPSVPSGHEGMSMPMDESMDAATQAKIQAKFLKDKRESEFNHHLAGFFVIVAGVFVLFQDAVKKRWAAAVYVWPASFLVSGLFLLVWSDTELWPFGHRQWLEALQNNPEVLQHKTFALLLLILGVIEWLRTNGRLKTVWSAWVFPAVSIVGSVMLLFHEHEGGMHGPNHMDVMARIKSEHLWFAITGFGIALTKGLAETNLPWRGVWSRLSPLLMIVLGILLLLYTE